MYNKTKNSNHTGNWLRILALLVVLALVAVIGVFALDGNSPYGDDIGYGGLYGYAPVHESYIDYNKNALYADDEQGYIGEYGGYNYAYDGYGVYPYGDYSSYLDYIDWYGYDEGGYIGYAPYYIVPEPFGEGDRVVANFYRRIMVGGITQFLPDVAITEPGNWVTFNANNQVESRVTAIPGYSLVAKAALLDWSGQSGSAGVATPPSITQSRFTGIALNPFGDDWYINTVPLWTSANVTSNHGLRITYSRIWVEYREIDFLSHLFGYNHTDVSNATLADGDMTPLRNATAFMMAAIAPLDLEIVEGCSNGPCPNPATCRFPYGENFFHFTAPAGPNAGPQNHFSPPISAGPAATNPWTNIGNIAPNSGLYPGTYRQRVEVTHYGRFLARPPGEGESVFDPREYIEYFPLVFVVLRPVTEVNILDPSNPTGDIDLTVERPIYYCPDEQDLYDNGDEIIVDGNTEDHEDDYGPNDYIRIVISPDCKYTVFCEDSLEAISVPPGWEVVDWEVDEDGNLEVIIRPLDTPDDPDWIRLNHAINHLSPPPSTIIIHQATAPNMPFSIDYHDIPNATFHLVVTDPAPGGYAGRTITTVPIPFAVGFPTDPYNLHRINITRPVTVRAADGANIYLRMPFYGSHAINTAPGAPWEVTVNNAFNRDLGRHFVVPTGISFTLGGTGTGNLTLDGNVSAQSAQPTARRGGIRVYGGALTMSTGSRITNSRNVSFWSINQDIPGSGGAVQAVNGANFTMTGNAIIENSEANTLSHFHAGPNPPGNLYTRGRTAHGGGVYVNDSTFNMSGDAIIRNNRIITSREGTSTAHSPLAILSISGEGGGVHITNDSNFTMSGSAEISGNIINTPTTTGFYAVASTVLLGGGGVAVWHGSTFTMSDNAVIRNNEANSTIGNRDGGGVVVRHQDSIFNMISGYIQDNTGENGGGVAMSGFGVTVDGVSTNYPSGIFTMTNGTIRNNTALASGGGVYVFSSLPFSNSPPSTFLMYAGIIGSNADDDEGNTAINGGGVHVAGGALFEMRVGTDVNNDPTSGTISGNSATGTAGTWPNINGGGGVHVVGTNSNFNMYAGTIGNNDAVFGGGGVLVLDNANFNLRETANKTITRNTATWGGGVWVAWVYDNASADTSHMTMEAGANNLHITHNTVTQRGGGIFTMAAEYADPLTRVSGTNIAFTNLALYRVNFSNNRAGHREVSPSNALDVMPDTVWSSLSTDTHPINNYDINFIGRGFELPLAGGTGTLMFIILGTMLLTVASAFILYKKYQVKSYDGFTKNGKVYSFKKLY